MGQILGKMIYHIGPVKIMQVGSNPNDCWYDVYINDKHITGRYNAGDAFQFAIDQQDNDCDLQNS